MGLYQLDFKEEKREIFFEEQTVFLTWCQIPRWFYFSPFFQNNLFVYFRLVAWVAKSEYEY